MISVPVKIEPAPPTEELVALQQLSIEEQEVGVSKEGSQSSPDIHVLSTESFHFSYLVPELETVFYLCIHHLIVISLFLLCVWIFYSLVSFIMHK